MLIYQNNACPTCIADKSDFSKLTKKYEIRISVFASYLHQQAKNLEESGSVKDADDFFQKYSQVYIEVCNYSKSPFKFIELKS